MTLAVIAYLIISEAIYEALLLRKKYILSGIIEFCYHAFVALVIGMFLTGWTWELPNDGLISVLIGWLFLRFAVFDFIFNIVARLPLFYIGNTKLYDKLWQRFFSWTGFPVGHFLWMFKLIALLIALSLLL